jgi:aspartate carbamoyltransferase catalytic subunit
MIRFNEQELEIMKKSGQVIGNVGNSYISEIYQLDRTRTVEDFEKQIKNIALRAISIGKNERESVYAEPLADLMEVINKYKDNYDEIKDIVLVYATYYLGVIKYSKNQ